MSAAVRLLAVLLLSLVLVSCSDEGGDPAAGAGAGVVPVGQAEDAIEAGATVIDVRTPQEYDAGHLPDAVNIDVSAPDFGDRVADLDPEGSYVVYCRSGSRSTVAAQAMLDDGFDDVVNAGGYQDLVSAGLG